MNFGSLHYFLKIKIIEKQLKISRKVSGLNPAHGLRLACHGVEGEGMRAVGGVRWARWEMARLTKEVRRRRGGR
jgi:hypothetical protein